ncbi:hypothetical protein HYQ44_015225 [Verticillium longisporum]|nr:hypothetical protein HYQ44_015225 [Verticillium longisporum]
MSYLDLQVTTIIIPSIHLDRPWTPELAPAPALYRSNQRDKPQRQSSVTVTPHHTSSYHHYDDAALDPPTAFWPRISLSLPLPVALCTLPLKH